MRCSTGMPGSGGRFSFVMLLMRVNQRRGMSRAPGGGQALLVTTVVAAAEAPARWCSQDPLAEKGEVRLRPSGATASSARKRHCLMATG